MHNLNFNVRKFKQGTGADVANFFAKYFPELVKGTQRHAFTPEYFDWKYGANPFGDSFVYQCWLDNEIIGTFGTVCRPFRIRNESVTGYLAVDSFIAPPYQGKHLNTVMSQKAYEAVDRVSNICIGVGVAPISLSIATAKRGYRKVLDYRKYRSFIRPDLILKAINRSIPEPVGKIATALSQPLLTYYESNARIAKIDKIDDIVLPKPDARLDFSIDRSYDYIKYRYFDCPESYHVYQIYSDHYPMYLVVKPIRLKNVRVTFLVDTIVDTNEYPACFIQIVKALNHIGRTTGTYACLIEHPEKQIDLKFALRSGFFPSQSVGTYIVRQNYWDFLKPNNASFDQDKWRISPGDGDNI
jgi:hypothetical protein